MDLRSIMNTDGPSGPLPPPNKLRKLSDQTVVSDVSAHHIQTQFLNSPSQTSRHSSIDFTPYSASRPRSEAAPSPFTPHPQIPAISPQFAQSNMPETVVSPQAYRSSFSQPASSPQSSRMLSIDQQQNGHKLEPVPRPVVPVNTVQATPERKASLVSKPRRQKFKEKPVWAMKVSEWQRLRPNSATQKTPEPKNELTPEAPALPPAPAPAPAPAPVVRPLQSPSHGWEPSIANILPSEEISRTIADFLFKEVIQRKDIPLSPTFSGKLEIEAKIGHIVNRDTNDRLRLPILTESILARNDPSLRTIFRSSMTEAQHRHFNQYLNEAVQKTLPKRAAPNGPPATPSNRVRMDYKHTREIDSFYELSPQAESALPASIRALIVPGRGGGPGKARVRVTTDQKDGRQLAQIIKVRLADLDVLSPATPFDWRLSVNLELDYAEGRENLVEVVEAGKRAPERNKDRMTYLHQCYQIDLTQVTVAGGGSVGGGAGALPPGTTVAGEKEHELEIELSVEELKREGEALVRGEQSRYEDMVRGLVDNVRILMRSCRV